MLFPLNRHYHNTNNKNDEEGDNKQKRSYYYYHHYYDIVLCSFMTSETSTGDNAPSVLLLLPRERFNQLSSTRL